MPVIPIIGRRHWRIRLLLGAMYAILTLLGITMVAPFLITLTSSIANGFDYERFTPAPRFLWSHADRYCRGLVPFFDKLPKWYDQMACALPATPAHWTTWRVAGRDLVGIEAMARQGAPAESALTAAQRRAAADYSEFVDQYPIAELLVPVSDLHAARFLAASYTAEWRRSHPEATRGEAGRQALALMSERWGLPMPSFYAASFEKSEGREPYWQQSWFPPEDPKYRDYLTIKDLYRHHVFTPGIAAEWATYLSQRGITTPPGGLEALVTHPSAGLQHTWSEFKAERAPAAPAVPFALRAVWRTFLDSSDVRQMLALPDTAAFDVTVYNRLAGTAYTALSQTPFPVPAGAPAALQALWTRFVETRFPARLTRVALTSETQAQYRDFLRDRFKTVPLANRMLETTATAWDDFALSAEPPAIAGQGGLRSVWIDFVKNLPAQARRLHCAEMDYQAFLLRKYGSLAAINAAQGLHLNGIEEAFPPFETAYAVTFARHEWSLTLRPLADNYRFILAYLLGQGRAILVTLALILASIVLTLIVNPMCAYALSRFGMRGKDRIILFLLATTAFPAMISAIPAYLLMRDLGLLNTLLALVLPGAANGMAIFMLKGFFDSLPPELYEAATIDGAKEHQIFLIITLPLMKPILAINALTAFIAAYSGWEWALIICQKKEMWTLSVWMYQANQMWAMDYPWIVAAGFVVVSLPTLLVFLFCQRIILRGIILPQMK